MVSIGSRMPQHSQHDEWHGKPQEGSGPSSEWLDDADEEEDRKRDACGRAREPECVGRVAKQGDAGGQQEDTRDRAERAADERVKAVVEQALNNELLRTAGREERANENGDHRKQSHIEIPQMGRELWYCMTPPIQDRKSTRLNSS